MKYEEIRIEKIWTSHISDDKIEDFLYVQNQVFQNNYNKKLFKRKYLCNIFGDSLIVLAYIDNKCVAARSFWKNEIDHQPAYQPCDTGVLEETRGHGLFKKMTLEGLDMLDSSAMIFNFPNDNSYNAYRKLGWELNSIKKFKVYNPLNDFKEIDFIPNSYLDWILSDNKKSEYAKINKKYYLIKRRKFNVFYILGEIDEKYIKKINRIKFPLLLIYSERGNIGRGLYTVTKYIEKQKKIPTYKIDTIFQ